MCGHESGHAIVDVAVTVQSFSLCQGGPYEASCASGKGEIVGIRIPENYGEGRLCTLCQR